MNEIERSSPRRGAAVRATALMLAVVLDALAFATVLRPRHGYTSTHRLLVTLAAGVAVALGALIIAGAAAAYSRRPGRSLWAATTALPTVSIVLALFITAAVGSQIVSALRAPASQGASTAARADFQRWQATVVPIVVKWTDTIRIDSAFIRGLRSTTVKELRGRVDRSERMLDGLARALAAATPRLPQRPRLRRLTDQLATALVLAREAQRTYALALAAAAHSRVNARGRGSGVRRLIDRGNVETRRSVAVMTSFSLDANGLGASLFVEKP